MLHFLLDYLENLSLLFKREQLFFGTVELHVKNKMASAESLKLSLGQYEERFIP
jgi:hypothetical protein